MKKLMMPVISVAALASACPVYVLGGPMNDVTEEALKDIKAELGRINGETKQTAEKALNEAKQAGEVSAETKKTADKLLQNQTDLSKKVENMTNVLEGGQTALRELEQIVASHGGGGGSSKVMTLGEAFMSNEDEIKAFNENGARGNLRISVANAVTTAAGSGGGLITQEEEAGVVRMPRRQLLVRQLLTQGKVGSDLVKYRKQVLRTDNAGMTAEGAASGQSDFGWDKATAQVKKIAHHTNISEETMADADLLQSEIDSEMRYGLDLEEEKQILAGDGVGENLNGLLTEAPAFATPHADLPNATHIDRLRLAFLKITLEDFVATSAVLNPIDWAFIDMAKDSTNRYIYGNPGSQTTPVLWGKDIVESNTMTQNEWLAGDLAMAATFYDRQETEVIISSEHDQNFIEDMLTMKARKRVALAIKRALAMVRGDFTFA